MTLGALALRHARAIALVAVALVVAGILAAFALPSGVYPPLQFPRIVIVAKSGTLPPQSMSLIVTRPLEQVVMSVPGIRRVRSKSIRGASEISAQFAAATDMVVALQMLQNRVAEITSILPAGTELQIERMTPEVFPVFVLSLTSDMPTADLYDYAAVVVKPEVARVPGVGIIEVQASDTREIEVVLDPAKLAASRLTVLDVADALKAQNTLMPIGRFQESGLQHLTLASASWASVDAIAAAPIRTRSGETMRLADLGTVTRGTPDRTLLVTGNGRDAVVMTIAQQIGANILGVKTGLDGVLTGMSKVLPAGIRINRVYDLAEFVEESIAGVRDAILVGSVLAIIVLLFALRDWRLTTIAAVTLPLAVIPTFAFMWLFGGTINLMSMGGLAVAIGLVIDDAVVVVENMHRRAGEGGTSVAEAVQQILAPLVSSTLTTVVVFAPLGLLSGVQGQFFRALSLSLSIAVLISLALSISLIPLMGQWAARHHRPSGESHGVFARTYGRMLGVAVQRPWIAVVAVVVLGVLAVGLFMRIGTGFFPAADEGGFVVDYVTPAGSALAETDRQVRAIEKVVAQTPEVATYSRRTGSELGLFATAQNTGDILVRLKPRGQRQRSADRIISDLRERVHHVAPLVDVEFVQLLQDMLGDLEGTAEPIEVKIFGDDPERLAELAEPVEELLGKIDGVVDVVGVQRGNPQVTWRIDPMAAARYGLAVEQVANQLAANGLGTIATELRLPDRTIPVRVRLPDAVRFDPSRLSATVIRTAEGNAIPLTELATMERENGQAELHRENLRPVALVSGRLEHRDLGGAVADIRAKLDTLRLPTGYTYEIGGQYESQRVAFRELLLVFALTVFLVFLILVSQFRAWVPAILIMLAAPFSLGGALLLLWLTGTDLNLSSAMGLILLVGLIVKNGIMLLDLSERLYEAGEPFDAAIAHAGRVRFRPILMTTFCTLFALLPLALGLGAGSELQRPLALAVIGGLVLSTLVTLLAVPGLYAATRRLRRSDSVTREMKG
ncbi:Cation efflux system protein CzcA [Luteitalea pratensis]|uniref:Cation efflux system protein CzcA n=1 Tax=Luteitalea pratensis TaxID=1855912 RepID=A0A143PKP3_LUTPR|nr:efflux RND transporter permease subunit [Luteitalea pratensis]AMY08344.1 Cation efflux system protein CzcA [Luteitalea pratensis]